MNCRPVSIWSLAALAGWLGMAQWREKLTVNKEAARDTGTVIAEAGPAGQSARRRPGAESGRLALLARRLTALPKALLAAERDKVKTWPPGAERAVALAMIDARRGMNGIEPADDPFDPFRPDAEPVVNRFSELEVTTRSGRLLEPGTLAEWAALDPAAARAAVLAMPDGAERDAAADAIAGVVGKSDPVAAMEFVRQAGGKFQGTGVAKAWLALMKTAAFPTAGAMPLLTPEQSEGLAAALGSLVEKQQDPYSGREISFSDGDLRELSKAILTTLQPGPERLRLVEKIAERDHRLLEFDLYSGREPENAVYAAAHLVEGFLAAPDVMRGNVPLLGKGDVFPLISVKTLETAAPRLLPHLAQSGHVAEAAQLLGRIQDATVRRTALEAILPAWMDADPAAARAAFEAAPLTVLERERWERHPAFLLHPASGK